MTTDDVFSQTTRLDLVDFPALHLVRGRGGSLAVMYETHWNGPFSPSWEQESGLQHFRLQSFSSSTLPPLPPANNAKPPALLLPEAIRFFCGAKIRHH